MKFYRFQLKQFIIYVRYAVSDWKIYFNFLKHFTFLNLYIILYLLRDHCTNVEIPAQHCTNENPGFGLKIPR